MILMVFLGKIGPLGSMTQTPLAGRLGQFRYCAGVGAEFLVSTLTRWSSDLLGVSPSLENPNPRAELYAMLVVLQRVPSGEVFMLTVYPAFSKL